MSFWSQVRALVAKDLLVEWRSKDLLATMAVLALSSVVLFYLAVDFSRTSFLDVGPAVLWVSFLSCAVLGLTRSFSLERENRCFEGLLLSPVDRSVIYVAKLLFNVLVLSALAMLLMVLGAVLLNKGPGAVELSLERGLALVGAIVLSVLGFAAVGTLAALMVQGTRRAELLLPTLQSILSLPALLCGLLATRRLLDPDTPLVQALAPVQLSAFLDVLLVAIALLVFEAVVEE